MALWAISAVVECRGVLLLRLRFPGSDHCGRIDICSVPLQKVPDLIFYVLLDWIVIREAGIEGTGELDPVGWWDDIEGVGVIVSLHDGML